MADVAKVVEDVLRSTGREIIREAVADELKKTLTPAFYETIQSGTAQLHRILDTVIEHDDRHDDLEKRLKILEAAVTELQR